MHARPTHVMHIFVMAMAVFSLKKSVVILVYLAVQFIMQNNKSQI